MALISTKNIAAPFTNKTNLVTLILIVVAFLFLRLAGGEIDLVNSNSSSSATSPSTYYEAPKEKSSNEEDSTRSLDELEELFQ